MIPGDENDGLCPFPKVGHDAIEEVHANRPANVEEIAEEYDACPPGLRLPMDVLEDF